MTRPYWGREREAPGGGGRLMPSLSPSNCSQWWTRQLVGEYFPAIERDNPSLQEFLRQRGWAPSEDALLHEATSPLIPALRWARHHAAATVAVFFAVAFIVAVVTGTDGDEGQ
eukprot:CAMPEP_0177769026 /NCGR_PEP_ID=MMETSP0491_2-20121128/10077_1 /TAXON_ID=63592 /ORGANISM="Tetraselmis chuii, Strain PLY429" /LENGTH=112 /DNA_ID=CAMNT_0019285957 /DNA_START=305 /DNA_END=644 /DNA_ORIENTATION=-